MKGMSSWDRAKAQSDYESIAIPRKVMHSEAFRHLTGSELRVLMLLLRAYTGSNNGSLGATKTAMKCQGGMDDKTLAKALHGLAERELIVKTGKAFCSHTGTPCNLYALTWLSIDDQ